MASTTPIKIGLILGSQRPVRIAPEVATFILDTLKRDSQNYQCVTIDRIDLVEHNLPLFNEPIIPMTITNPAHYHQPHTRTWSRRIAACDAFIILSSQRNWGIPAELKNAIDYLFNEWKGKPVALITYGGHGGEQCAEQLRQVLGAMGCKVLERGVGMAFEGAEFKGNALRGKRVGLDAGKEGGLWSKYQGRIVEVFDELVEVTRKGMGEKENGAVM